MNSPQSDFSNFRARAALVNITDEELNAKVKRQRQQQHSGSRPVAAAAPKTPDEKLLCTLAQPSWAYYDSRGNVAREDGRHAKVRSFVCSDDSTVWECQSVNWC